jgi:hypothetical protein
MADRRGTSRQEDDAGDVRLEQLSRRDEELGDAAVGPGGASGQPHRVVESAQVEEAAPFGRVGAQQHRVRGEGDEEQDRGGVPAADERDSRQRDAGARERTGERKRRRTRETAHGDTSEGEALRERCERADDRGNARADECRHPARASGRPERIRDGAEGDDGERRAEGKRGEAVGDGRRLGAPQESEREERTDQLGAHQAGGRDEEEAEDDGRVLRVQRGELEPPLGDDGEELGREADDDERPPRNEARLERAAQRAHRDQIDPRREQRERQRESEPSRPRASCVAHAEVRSIRADTLRPGVRRHSASCSRAPKRAPPAVEPSVAGARCSSPFRGAAIQITETSATKSARIAPKRASAAAARGHDHS